MLRVIAVERFAGTKPVIACVYKDESICLSRENIFFTKYFENFPDLRILLSRKGMIGPVLQSVRGFNHENANGDILSTLSFDFSGFPAVVSPVTLRLFMEFEIIQ